MNRILITCSLIALACIAVSCSSGNGVTTPSTNGVQASTYTSFPIAVSDWADDGTPSGGSGVLGLYQVYIDVDSLTGEMVSLREATTADTVEVIDITNYLTISPCFNCAKISDIKLTADSDLSVTFSIKHPFPMGNPSQPIKYNNRSDLLVYNVEGIIVGDGPQTTNALGVYFPNTLLKNADGYTGYLNTSLQNVLSTTSTIHPYKLHFDDFSAGNYNPGTYPATGFPPAPTLATGNLVMSQGADYNAQEYIFDLNGDGDLNFVFAIGATYGINTAGRSTWFTPEARVPQHNKKAASQVEVEIFENNLIPGVQASDAVLHIKVLDMNHGAAVGSAINQIKARSDVSEISVMVPNVMVSPVVVTNPTPDSGSPRDPLNPLNFILAITNSASANVGTYYGVVKVKDSYAPGQNTPPLTDGIARVAPGGDPSSGYFTIAEFATYQTFSIDIISTCGPITGQIDTGCPTEGVPDGTLITFEVSAVTGPSGGSIILYEIDWDYDGVTFNADPNYAGNTDGIFTDVGPFVNPNCPDDPPDPRTYTVAFRAVDECDPPIPTIFDTCEVVVDSCEEVTYYYAVDPDRQGLDISDLSITQPVSPTAELDIAVCENSSEPDIDGVYMFDIYEQVCRFDLDYVDSMFQATAWAPSDMTETHPNPDDPMPGFRLDITTSGYLVTCYYDTWESLDFGILLSDPFWTDPFAESNFFVWHEPTLPRPPSSAWPPFPHDPFVLEIMTDGPGGSDPDNSEPLEDPLAWETWDESNNVWVSSPSTGDPDGPNPYQQPDNCMGVSWSWSEPTLADPTYGYTTLYFGYEPPYYTSTGGFYNLYDYAWRHPYINGQELVGIDRSDTDWLWFGFNGPVMASAYLTASNSLIFIIDINEADGWYGDLNYFLTQLWPDDYPSLPTNNIIDIECIPFDPDDPIIFDYYDEDLLEYVPAPQIAALAAILHENKHIYLVCFDDLTESWVFYADIDGTVDIPGDPKHLDVGEESMDIHVSSSDGTTAYATVFKLTPRTP